MFKFLSRYRLTSPADDYIRRPTLVLLNGLAEQRESWYRNRAYWQHYFDVQMPGILVYDGPVIQERMHARQPITVGYLTARLTEFLDKFVQAPPYHLVASSLGGQIAVEYTVSNPDKVGGVVLLCPSGMGCEEKLPVTERTRHNDYEGLVGSTFYDRSKVTPGVVQYYEKKFASRAWRKAVFQTIRGTKGHSVREKLPHMSRPTLVICGEQDQIVDPHHVERTVRGLKNFDFVMIPRCGHAPQLERPKIVNHLVLDFLRRRSSAEPHSAKIRQEAEADLVKG